jgi:hypothetical protein
MHAPFWGDSDFEPVVAQRPPTSDIVEGASAAGDPAEVPSRSPGVPVAYPDIYSPDDVSPNEAFGIGVVSGIVIGNNVPTRGPTPDLQSKVPVVKGAGHRHAAVGSCVSPLVVGPGLQKFFDAWKLPAVSASRVSGPSEKLEPTASGGFGFRANVPIVAKGTLAIVGSLGRPPECEPRNAGSFYSTMPAAFGSFVRPPEGKPRHFEDCYWQSLGSTSNVVAGGMESR